VLALALLNTQDANAIAPKRLWLLISFMGILLEQNCLQFRLISTEPARGLVFWFSFQFSCRMLVLLRLQLDQHGGLDAPPLMLKMLLGHSFRLWGGTAIAEAGGHRAHPGQRGV
jgi:hypothetical protein